MGATLSREESVIVGTVADSATMLMKEVVVAVVAVVADSPEECVMPGRRANVTEAKVAVSSTGSKRTPVASKLTDVLVSSFSCPRGVGVAMKL